MQRPMQRRKLLKFGAAAVASLNAYPVWAAAAQSGRGTSPLGFGTTVTPLMLKDFREPLHASRILDIARWSSQLWAF